MVGVQVTNVPAGGTRYFDVVIVGAGVAGLVAALDLLAARPELAVAVVDKGAIGSAGSTPLAQGGMAAAVGPDDSPALHGADTIRAGDGLCDSAAVAALAAETPARVADLIRWGARFDRSAEGSLHLSREGGQTVARSVHTADATGAEIFRTLRAAATGRVTRLQGVVCELAVTREPGPRVVGVWVLLDQVDSSATGPEQEPGIALVSARDVVLATGGCGGLYAATTNRDGATGDGVALAHRAGAALVDMEFIQFHPTGLKVGEGAGCWRLLLTEALRGAGAVLVDQHGSRFMRDRHPDAELAPRHVVTKAILDQPGGAWLDATALGADALAAEFPTVLSGARAHGFDLAREPVPVDPAEHYMIGGVATDLWGATSLPGLSAAGEVACTGVHGANRMAGNSLAQSCVFGARTARRLATTVPAEESPAGDPDPEPPRFADGDAAADGATLGRLRAQLRVHLSAGAGPIRTAETLDGAAKALAFARATAGERPAATSAGIELHHAITVGELIVRSARLRAESRGVHWRDDAPTHDPAWAGVHLRIQPPT